MKIQIASDLHLEFPWNREFIRENPLLPAGDILLLAGDIVSDRYKDRAGSFYDSIDDKYRLVISTFGNHEFYRGIASYTFPSYRSFARPGILRLNNESVTVDNVRVIASCLWSFLPNDLDPAFFERLNDFRQIFKKDCYYKINISMEDFNLYNRISHRYILNEISKPFEGKTVLMTHFPPAREVLEGVPFEDNLKIYLSSDMGEEIIDKVDLCVFGHIHFPVDMTIGRTRFAANPLGYEEEGHGIRFKRDFVVEV